MLTTLPLEAFVCREVMFNYWFPDEPWDPNRHLIFTSALVVSAMALSLVTCDLGAVFELIGATSACALAYILPPLCYIKLSTRSWKTIPAYVCVVFGILVMSISLVQATTKIIRSKTFPTVGSPAPFTYHDGIQTRTVQKLARYEFSLQRCSIPSEVRDGAQGLLWRCEAEGNWSDGSSFGVNVGWVSSSRLPMASGP